MAKYTSSHDQYVKLIYDVCMEFGRIPSERVQYIKHHFDTNSMLCPYHFMVGVMESNERMHTVYMNNGCSSNNKPFINALNVTIDRVIDGVIECLNNVQQHLFSFGDPPFIYHFLLNNQLRHGVIYDHDGNRREDIIEYIRSGVYDILFEQHSYSIARDCPRDAFTHI